MEFAIKGVIESFLKGSWVVWEQKDLCEACQVPYSDKEEDSSA